MGVLTAAVLDELGGFRCAGAAGGRAAAPGGGLSGPFWSGAAWGRRRPGKPACGGAVLGGGAGHRGPAARAKGEGGARGWGGSGRTSPRFPGGHRARRGRRGPSAPPPPARTPPSASSAGVHTLVGTS